jgi:hypothetical protein
MCAQRSFRVGASLTVIYEPFWTNFYSEFNLIYEQKLVWTIKHFNGRSAHSDTNKCDHTKKQFYFLVDKRFYF